MKKQKSSNCIYADANRRVFINFNSDDLTYMKSILSVDSNAYTIFIIPSKLLDDNRSRSYNTYNMRLCIKSLLFYARNNDILNKIKVVICPCMQESGYNLYAMLKFDLLSENKIGYITYPKFTDYNLKIQGSRSFFLRLDEHHRLYHELTIERKSHCLVKRYYYRIYLDI